MGAPRHIGVDEQHCRQLRADGLTYLEIGEQLGACPTTVRRWLVHGFPEIRVDNTPLRDAFLRSGWRAFALAREIGMVNRRGVPDSTGLRVALGIKPTVASNSERARPGDRACRQTMTASLAERLLSPLGLDPWEVGL